MLQALTLTVTHRNGRQETREMTLRGTLWTADDIRDMFGQIARAINEPTAVRAEQGADGTYFIVDTPAGTGRCGPFSVYEDSLRAALQPLQSIEPAVDEGDINRRNATSVARHVVHTRPATSSEPQATTGGVRQRQWVED